MKIHHSFMWTAEEVKIIEDFQDLIVTKVCDTFHLTEQSNGCADCPFGVLCELNYKNLGRALEERVPDLVFTEKIWQGESEG